jgi:hypothetical protein
MPPVRLSTSEAGKELPDILRPGLSYGHRTDRRSASAPRRASAWCSKLRCLFSVPHSHTARVTIYWHPLFATTVLYFNNGSMIWARACGALSVVLAMFSLVYSHLASGKNSGECVISASSGTPPRPAQNIGRACGTIPFGA